MRAFQRGVVVQLVRIPACHAGGRGFESRPLRHKFQAEKRLSGRFFVAHISTRATISAWIAVLRGLTFWCGRVFDRSVTALADNPASPAPSLPHHVLNHARAHKAAHWLCAFGHRCCSCPAAAAPLRRPAKRPLAGLRLAGGYLVVIYTTPSRGRAASRLCPSCYRRPVSADFYTWPAWMPTARRLHRRQPHRRRRRRRGVATMRGQGKSRRWRYGEYRRHKAVTRLYRVTAWCST